MLFRPSLPWGFAAGSGSIFGVAACHRSSSSSRKQEEKVATIIFFYRFQKSSRSSSSRRKQEEKVAKIIFFYGFQSYIRQFLAAILMLFRPSLPWGFAAGSGSSFGNRRKMGICCWEWFDFGVAACSSSRKQEEKVATSFFL